MDTLFELEPGGALLPLPPTPVVLRRVPPRAGDWPTVKKGVLERDGWICQRCGILCAPTKSKLATRGRWATVDHIVPRALGGWDDPVNLQVLCYACNEKKAEKVIDYRADVALRLALEAEIEKRGLIPDEMRALRGSTNTREEKLSVVLTCRVTPTEAAALEKRYGSRTSAARAGVDRLLYAG